MRLAGRLATSAGLLADQRHEVGEGVVAVLLVLGGRAGGVVGVVGGCRGWDTWVVEFCEYQVAKVGQGARGSQDSPLSSGSGANFVPRSSRPRTHG